MITVLYSTARAPYCYYYHPDWDQYAQLARDLSVQTYQDFELVVVTPHAEHAREVLRGVNFRHTVVEPRSNPWRQARMFCAASARNTGIIHARGECVVSLDDCTGVPPDLLVNVARRWEQGLCVGLLYQNEAGVFHDMRAKWFNEHCGSDDTFMLDLRMKLLPPPQGMLSYPLQSALVINGYDEHFDGARGLEDVEFSRRLMRVGVPYLYDRRCMVTLHQHIGYPDEIVNNEDQGARCCNPTYVLAMERPSLEANRTPYNKRQMKAIIECFFWQDDGSCGYHGMPCPVPQWAKSGHPVARRIMVEEGYPETVDLRAERKKVGL